MISRDTKIEEKLTGIYLEGFDDGVYSTIEAMNELGLINEKMAELIKEAFYKEALIIRTDDKDLIKFMKKQLEEMKRIIREKKPAEAV